MYKFQSNLQRLERELQTLKKDENEITVQTLLQHLSEVITVQTVVMNEKLPAEIHAQTNRIKALNTVKQYSYLNPDQITGLRNNLDSIAKEIQNLIELKVNINFIIYYNISFIYEYIQNLLINLFRLQKITLIKQNHFDNKQLQLQI